MLWVKFQSLERHEVVGMEGVLDTTGASAYNARQSPGRPVRAGPLPDVEREGTPTDMARLRGSVKWFDPEKGWGFIRLEDGDEVFVHHSDIQGTGFRSLRDGAEVELEVERADRGPRARNVIPLGGVTSEPEPSSRTDRTASERAGGREGTGRSRPRNRDRDQAGRNRDRKDRQPAGAVSKLQTLNEQIRQRLAGRFTFRS